ncbi:hypothetical protein DFQ01_103174 [Paenibacillus cellulosilyticus]|uniref:Glycosyl hydrolase family 98 putative carbohydrate-binding module domain-containing protein n=1 Tax=Paenibacillus cellulosilyticus TaxID=375489 RepID=A0A2V2YX05_9BACL|nr:hypothetical protein [Paenibacillus cellulosilyticus]PWW06272.1 hypothetical protein DFQ01_103174 [Paenibacillus cellulosilyticus]QKS42976.1 hypothetical protein HUB94_00305 [Paenibacillus cellulosilyticus]
MKKFIIGFLAGGLIFGTASAYAAVKISVDYNRVNTVYVDGVKKTITTTNKPIYIDSTNDGKDNGVTYFPSTLLPELGYQPSRSGDTVFLNAAGAAYYPIRFNDFTPNSNVIAVEQVNTTGALADVVFNGAVLINSQSGATYRNYMKTELGTLLNKTKSQSEFTLKIDEKYRRFQGTLYLGKSDLGKIPSKPVQLEVNLTDDSGKLIKYKTYTVSKLTRTQTINIPLRYISSISFKLSNDGSETADAAILEPVFIK